MKNDKTASYYGQSIADIPLQSCALIEDGLKAHLAALKGYPRLIEAMKYATLNGGKRIRARLVLASCCLFDIDIKQALQAALAVEFIHAYSLVHDDLPAMDDDDMRRGKPTLHVAFDEATAIMAGNALFGEAFRALTQPGSDISADTKLALVHGLIEAANAEGMLGGQMMDLEAEGRFSSVPPELTLSGIKAIQLGKTGALFRFACLTGPHLANAGTATLALFSKIADHIGYAFQIKDDLLDIHGTKEVLGKATGKDMNANKGTLVRLLGEDQARIILDTEVNRALTRLDDYKNSDSNLFRTLIRFIAERNY